MVKIILPHLFLYAKKSPAGVDIEAAKELSRNVIWALSLPGKTAPISAGKIICDTVKNILEELEAG